MNCDSKLQPKMNRKAKIIIAVLAVLLAVSVVFNIYLSSAAGCGNADSTSVIISDRK